MAATQETTYKKKYYRPVLAVLFLFMSPALNCQNKEQAAPEIPKHYFNSVFILDGYQKPKTTLDTSELGKRLKTYAIKQYNFSFYIPLLTKDFKPDASDTNVIGNSHLLLTGNFLSLQPEFDGIKQHRLTRRSIGLRYIYNTGKKGVWFFDFSPFVTRDATFRSTKAVLRIASTAVYSYNPNDKFNFRIGYARLFFLGNRSLFPFIGLRFGRLDKVHLSIQFPRSINLTIPLGASCAISLYTKPQGGVFNFSNSDSLYPKKSTAVFHFTRNEINTGLRFDCKIKSSFSFYLCAGLSTRNNITFYSNEGNKTRSALLPYNTYFYSTKPNSTGYAQFGLILRLGKTRSYYNNRNIYDAIDLNNKTNMHDFNPQIPVNPRKLPKNLESIKDLMEDDDY